MKRLLPKFGVVVILLAITANPLALAQEIGKTGKILNKQSQEIIVPYELHGLLPDIAAQQNPPPTAIPRSAIDCSVCGLPDTAFIIDASTGEAYWRDRNNPQSDRNKTRFRSNEKIEVVVIRACTEFCVNSLVKHKAVGLQKQ